MYTAHYPGAAQVAVIGVPILLYPLPALIAYINRRKHARAIMLLNLSFGWTFLGWVLALILACMPRSGRLAGRARDRKSTRLNSSHGYISYAVFCLKKKNTLVGVRDA